MLDGWSTSRTSTSGVPGSRGSLRRCLARQPGPALVIVLPVLPDLDGTVSRMTQWHACRAALRPHPRGGATGWSSGLTNDDGLPICVHLGLHHRRPVGQCRFRTTSTAGPGPATARSRVSSRDERTGPWPPTRRLPDDVSCVRLRRLPCAEHLGIEEDDVPDDPPTNSSTFWSTGDRPDKWYAAGAGDQPHGIRRTVARVHGRRRGEPVVAQAAGRDRAARAAADILERSTGLAQRPPGQLRLLTEPELQRHNGTIANLPTNVFDPDGTPVGETLRGLGPKVGDGPADVRASGPVNPAGRRRPPGARRPAVPRRVHAHAPSTRARSRASGRRSPPTGPVASHDPPRTTAAGSRRRHAPSTTVRPRRRPRRRGHPTVEHGAHPPDDDGATRAADDHADRPIAPKSALT